MSHHDIRSAIRPDPDQPMVDIADVLAVPLNFEFGDWLGLLIVGVIAWLLYRTATWQG